MIVNYLPALQRMLYHLQLQHLGSWQYLLMSLQQDVQYRVAENGTIDILIMSVCMLLI